MAVNPASLVSSCRYKSAHTFSVYHQIQDIKKLHDDGAISSDVIWLAGAGEFSRILSLSVEFFNPSPQHLYIRAQIPEAYKDDVFSLYAWHNLQRSRGNSFKRKGKKKGKKRTSGVKAQDAGILSQYVRVRSGERVVRNFRAWSKGFVPRWASGQGKGSQGMGPHLFSYVPFAETLSVAGTDLSKSLCDGLEVKITVTFVSPSGASGPIKEGALVLSTVGYARLDFTDPPPALEMRVHDLSWAGGTVDYAVLTFVSGIVNLTFFDGCGNKTANPIGLNPSYVYTVPLGIVDEVQGTQKESVNLFNQIGFSSNKWVYGSIATSAAGRALFTARQFASDPGSLVLPGDAKLSVYSTQTDFVAPVKILTAHIRGVAGTHRLVSEERDRGKGWESAGGMSILATTVTILSFVLEVLRMAVTAFDAPNKATLISFSQLTAPPIRHDSTTSDGFLVVPSDTCSADE